MRQSLQLHPNDLERKEKEEENCKKTNGEKGEMGSSTPDLKQGVKAQADHADKRQMTVFAEADGNGLIVWAGGSYNEKRMY